MVFEVIILAAGQGTRMRSTLPKVLHLLAGKPMVSHVINTSKGLGAKAIHIVVGHGAERVRECHNNEALHWAQQEQQLGTGHAVAQALPAVAENTTVLVVYGDVPLIKTSTLKKLIESVNKNTLALLTVELDDPTGYGRIVRDPDDHILSIVEQKDATQKQLTIAEVNTGILAVDSNKLNQWLPRLSANNAQGEYYLTDIIEMAVNDGMNVIAQQPDAEWEVQGVNTREQLSQLERIYQFEQAKRLMSRGATIADPARIDVRGTLTVGQDVFIDINCVFVGTVNLADNVSIGPNCVIENADIGVGSVVKANTVIESASVAKYCDVGPFARLRPNTELANKARVGNFVELKNTKLGPSSKANHLAYVGDSDVGEHCNIGAGTITCNYDGANKYKTTMGDNVFIGSNSTLVAPVTINTDGFVGAGSTVTKDVPSKNLAIGRGKQRNVEGWERPRKK